MDNLLTVFEVAARLRAPNDIPHGIESCEPPEPPAFSLPWQESADLVRIWDLVALVRKLLQRSGAVVGRQYINSVELSNSSFDLELRCRDRSSKGDSGEEIVLVMCWPHVKAFADLLNKNLKAYETAFGEVRLQPLENAEKALKEIGAEMVAVKPSEGHE